MPVSSERSSVVRVRSVAFIAMLATVRKLIQPGEALVVVAAMLALGVALLAGTQSQLRFGRLGPKRT